MKKKKLPGWIRNLEDGSWGREGHGCFSSVGGDILVLFEVRRCTFGGSWISKGEFWTALVWVHACSMHVSVCVRVYLYIFVASHV